MGWLCCGGRTVSRRGQSVFYCCREGLCKDMHADVVLGTPVDVAEEAEKHFVFLDQYPTEQTVIRPVRRQCGLGMCLKAFWRLLFPSRRGQTTSRRTVKEAIPYFSELPLAFEAGRVIAVKGIAPLHCSRFAINLSCGLGPSPDIALHLNPRFDEKRVVRNYRVHNRWGEEEETALCRFPLARGEPFVIVVFATNDEYLIAINGRHYCSFAHRFPLQKVQVVQICGEVTVDSLEYRRMAIYPEVCTGFKNQPLAIPFGKSLIECTDETMETPFVAMLDEFGVGHEVEIVGRVKILPNSFYVNLQHGWQMCPHPIIPLHINPRFRAGYNLVRNAWIKGRWGAEEKVHCSHFCPGRPFTLKIVCGSEEYSVYVDGSLMNSFKFRCSPEIVNALYIQGDVFLKDVIIR